MKKITLLMLSFCLLLAWHSHGQIGPVEVTGFTDDIVANGIGSMDDSTTNIADDDSFCLISEDWKLNSTDSPISVGLPEDGIIISTTVTDLTYQIPTAFAPYDGNNSLRINESGSENAGTLSLVDPASYTTFYLLVFSGSGESDVDITINFTDATSETFSNNIVPDWFVTGDLPVEIQGFGRGDVTNDNVETPLNNPKLFRLELTISEANQAKNVESITVSRNNPSIDTAVFNLIAVSGIKIGCPPPANITVADITETTANLSWDPVSAAANGYEWFVFNAGDDPSMDTPVATGTTPMGTTTVAVSGLTEASSYDLYVSTDCGTDGVSDLSDSISFLTMVPPPECGGKFYDTGGANGDFTNNEDYTTVISPNTEGNLVIASFISVNNSSYDILTVDLGDGNPIVVPEIDPGAGDSPVSYTSVAQDGSLIFHFTSTSAVTNPGWEADITCSPLGIEEKSMQRISFAPNPVTKKLMIETSKKIQQIAIYDLNGKKIIEKNIFVESDPVLNLQRLEAGLYLIRVMVDGAEQTFKIIKQ